MKRLFYLCSALLLCLGIMFYKPAPTYNPFDGIFDIDTNQLSECDTIIGSCGYVNFQPKTDERLKVDYQIYGNNVVGKGFTYVEDTIPIPENYKYDTYIDSIMKLPIDIEEFNKALKRFDYIYLDKKRGEYDEEVWIIHKNNSDTVKTYLLLYGLDNDSTQATRTINYHKSKPRIIRNANGDFID